jgi:hypothetical protein
VRSKKKGRGGTSVVSAGVASLVAAGVAAFVALLRTFGWPFIVLIHFGAACIGVGVLLVHDYRSHRTEPGSRAVVAAAISLGAMGALLTIVAATMELEG